MKNSNGNISIHAQNIMPVIKKWLYSDKDIFVRELVSNGCDAVTKRRIAEPDAQTDYRVIVEADEKKGVLRFIDNGIGMTADEVDRYINQVAFSGAEDFLKQYSSENGEKNGIIGHFGLGFYSAFMVSSRVEIDTLSCTEGAEPVRWVSEDGMQYEISEGSRTEVGTTVTLTVLEEEHEFLHLHTLRSVLEKYCGFMSVPIYLREAGEAAQETETETAGSAEDGDAKEKEEKKPEPPKPINETHPLWLRNPSECTDDEYKAFYSSVFHQFEPPLFWVHLNVDYPFNLKGILFFPKLRNDFGGMTEGPIKLFSGQVFVADNIKEIIPEFLTLLKGVIDCPDIPLNVSRSFLQNDGYVRRLSSYITRKVADRLTGLFASDRESFEKYWDDIHPFVKYGCMKDESFYEKVKDILLLKLTDGRRMTLQEYLDANKEKAENKVFYAADAKIQAAAVSLYTDQGIDVALLDSPLDVNFISFLEMKRSELKFARVDADVSGLRCVETDTGDGPDQGKLEGLFREALGNEKLEVSLESLRSEEIPAIAIEDEQMRRFKEMSRLYGNSFAMPDAVKLTLNRRNPLIRSLSRREVNEETFTLCRQLYDLAEMTRQPLDAQRMSEFIARSYKLLTLAAGDAE